MAVAWILPALLYPFFFGIVNHIDKILLSRYFKGGGAGSLVIFSAAVGIPVSVLIALFNPSFQAINPVHVAVLILNGIFYMGSVVPYLYALNEDEASIVSPLSQLISPISLILGFIFLKERIETQSLLGGVIVMGAAILLTLEFKKKGKVRVKKKVIGLMFLASLLVALNGLIFKSVAIEGAFWATAFWEYIGVVVFGILAFCFVPSYRHQFLEVIAENKLSILSLNAINELFAVIAKLALHFATLLAPLALVFWVAEGFQPVFVVLFGILLTVFLPKISKEKIDRKSLIQKGIAILGMLIGTYLLL